MDGFAFDGAQLVADAPLSLKVIGTALAGKAWSGSVQPGECVRIMTGAIMPAGLDTVVPQELTTTRGRPGHDSTQCAARRRQPPPSWAKT